MNPATDLQEAYRTCDPSLPLMPDHPSYVSRPDSSLEPLERTIRFSKHPIKVLVSGQRGVGKTTELSALAKHFSEQFLVVWVNASEYLDLADASAEDVLLAVASAIYLTARDAGLPIQPEIVEEFQGWLTAQSQYFATYSAGTSTPDQLFVTLALEMRLSTAVRKGIRTDIAPRITELIEWVNVLIMSAQVASRGKPILLIVDDLDKVSLDASFRLFVESWPVISAPIAHIVYVFPIPLFFGPNIALIRSSVDAMAMIPNVAPLRFDGSPHYLGLAYLREVLLKRVTSPLISDEAIELIIRASGGNLRELLILIRDASLKAGLAGRTSIAAEDAQRAAAQLRREFQRMLRPQDISVLQEVHRTKRLIGESIYLLMSNVVLEYQNDEIWYDVHPALLPLLVEVH